MAEETKAAAPAAAEKPKTEKQTNCLSCNKPIKRIKRYYRDQKYYCSKKCWRAYKTKPKEDKK